MFHVNKRIIKVKAAETRIKKPSKTYRLYLELIQRIQMIAI